MGGNTHEPDVYVPTAYAVAVPVKEAEPEIAMVPINVSAPPEDQLPDASPSEKLSQTNVPSENQTQTVTETAEDKKEEEKTEEKDAFIAFESMTSQVSQMLSNTLSSITGTVNTLNKNQGRLQKDWNSMTKSFKTLSKNLSPILNLFKGCGGK
jgi:hypothetical protein